MREVEPLQQGELLVVGRVVGHDAEPAPVVDDALAADVLDDRRVAVRILEGEVHGGARAARLGHHDLHVPEQVQGLRDSSSAVEKVLRPEASVESRLLRIPRAEVGRGEEQQVRAQAALVQPVGGADAVDGGDQAGVRAHPGQRVLGNGDLVPDHAPVPLRSAREDREHGLGRLGPVHGAADHGGQLIVVPEDPRTHAALHAGGRASHAAATDDRCVPLRAPRKACFARGLHCIPEPMCNPGVKL